MTLRFIGDVDDGLARDVAYLLGGIRRPAFRVQLDGLDSFGGHKPRAVVAPAQPVRELIELQAEHERLMQRVGLEPERKYKPHVTLARLRDASSRQVADYLASRQPFRPAVDPDAYFPSPSHEEAIAALAAGFARRDPVVVIDGKMGVGKSLVARKWLEHLLPDVPRVSRGRGWSRSWAA